MFKYNTKNNQERSNLIILEPKEDTGIVEEMLKNSGRKIVKINLSKIKCGWINPFTGESSYIEELKEKAKSAIKSKNYRKAYRLLGKVKKLQKQFI